MSFSLELKNEITQSKTLRTRCKKAHAYGLFAFGKKFSDTSVLFTSENFEIVKLYTRFLQDFAGRNADISVHEQPIRDKTVYTVRLNNEQDKLTRVFEHDGEHINTELLQSSENLHAFISGAYLACGNITDPNKSYHIEFVVKDERLCDDLIALLDICLPGAKKSTRRGGYIVYYKEYSQIEDLITLMGAPKTCLGMIEIEMLKGIRNNANRATNCETANIDKIVNAAADQIEDINLVIEAVGLDNLPQPLKDAALLRLGNPDSSLRELAGLPAIGLSRSGINHRLNRLSKMADEIRADRRSHE